MHPGPHVCEDCNKNQLESIMHSNANIIPMKGHYRFEVVNVWLIRMSRDEDMLYPTEDETFAPRWSQMN